MKNAVGVRLEIEFPSLGHAGAILSQVYREQLEAVQRHIPRSSHQVQFDVALGVALGAVRAIWADDPYSEAGYEAGELLRHIADQSPSPEQRKDFEQWAGEQFPDLTGRGIFSPLGSASQLLWEGMRLRQVLGAMVTGVKGENNGTT